MRLIRIDAAPARALPISLRQLRFFVALSETANFSRAAEAMAVSQPALSAAIRQVEALLDVRLFDRTTHSVVLTEAGRALLPHAQRLLTTADNAFLDIGAVALRQQATVRIGAIPSALPAVATTIARIDQAAAGVRVHLADGTSDALIAQLHRGALDMAICVASRIDEGLASTLLVEDDMLLVLPADHPRAIADRLAWSALAGEEIVHFTGGSIGELSSAAMRQNNLSHSRRYRVDQVESLFGLVRSGLAIGVMPRLYTRGYGQDRVALVPLIRPAIRRRLVLLRRAKLAEEHPPAGDVATRIAADLRLALQSP